MISLQGRKYRLYTGARLSEGDIISLDKDASRYIFSVLRLSEGQRIFLFNEKDGEFEAILLRQPKLELLKKIKEPTYPTQELHLAIGLTKNAAMADIIDQATQMGVTHIWPLLTQHSQHYQINLERLTRIAQEAAEQCGICYVPEIKKPTKILDLPLKEFASVILANEKEEKRYLEGNLVNFGQKILAIVGPEGGFCQEEINSLIKQGATSVKISQNILKSQTAVVTLLAHLQLCTCANKS